LNTSDYSADIKLLEVINEHAPAVTAEDFGTPFRELGLDSLAQLNIRVAIEKSFGRKLTHKEWFACRTFSELLILLKNRI